MDHQILRKLDDGVAVSVRVQPRASVSEIAGAYGDRAVKIRLAAPPVDGAANDELVSFLADLFDIPRRRVSLERGHGSRDKQVRIRGISVAEARRVFDL